MPDDRKQNQQPNQQQPNQQQPNQQPPQPHQQQPNRQPQQPPAPKVAKKTIRRVDQYTSEETMISDDEFCEQVRPFFMDERTQLKEVLAGRTIETSRAVFSLPETEE